MEVFPRFFIFFRYLALEKRPQKGQKPATMRQNLTYRTMLWRLMLLVGALLMGACNQTEEAPEPTIPIPTITLQASESASKSLSFIANSTNASEVVWYCSATLGEEYTSAEHTGTARTNRRDEVVISGLQAATTYTIIAVASNGKHSTLSAPIEMATLDLPVPTLTLAPVGAWGTTLTFSLTSADASEVRWLCLEGDKKAPTEEELLKQGKRATHNTTIEVEVAELTPQTDYTIYALALNERYRSPIAELSVTTAAEGVEKPEEIPDEPAEPGFGGDIDPELGPIVKP